MNEQLDPSYREGLERFIPNAKTRLDLLDLQYGEDFADAVHDAAIFLVTEVSPLDPSEAGDGNRWQDFVRAAMFSMDIEWLVVEVNRMRGVR